MKKRRNEAKRIEYEILQTMSSKEDDELSKDFTEDEVKEAVKELKKNKAPGPDGITNDMIQKGGDIVIRIMTKFFNKLLREEAQLPESWKMGDIVSVYKGKGKRDELTNQRGLSLTLCMLKLLEKVISNRISKNIQAFSTSLQGGGKKGEATEEYLLIMQTVIERRTIKKESAQK